MTPSADVPKIAVAMPAYNAASFISAALESVLLQSHVDLEIVVVDDGSTDRTADIAKRYAERGVHVVRNGRRRGIGYSHNVALRESTAPLIAHVDADDMIVPGALARMAAAFGDDRHIGQAYCDFYDIDAHGDASPMTIDAARAFFARHRAPPIDYCRELVVHGMVVSALRTYRREVFDRVGLFSEKLPWAVDYEMALRIAERFTFAHVPELLYLRRVHPSGTSQQVRKRSWAQWQMRSRLVRHRLRHHHNTLFGYGPAATYARLLLGLAYVARDAMTPVKMDS
jgi:glycosyltransferase involved in cell wall biosynthesis